MVSLLCQYFVEAKGSQTGLRSVLIAYMIYWRQPMLRIGGMQLEARLHAGICAAESGFMLRQNSAHWRRCWAAQCPRDCSRYHCRWAFLGQQRNRPFPQDGGVQVSRNALRTWPLADGFQVHCEQFEAFRVPYLPRQEYCSSQRSICFCHILHD